MNEKRLSYLKTLIDEKEGTFEYTDYTVSELKELIEETPLCKENRDIAYMRFVDVLTVEQIAAKVFLSERTVYRRIPQIESMLAQTLSKLNSDGIVSSLS